MEKLMNKTQLLSEDERSLEQNVKTKKTIHSAVVFDRKYKQILPQTILDISSAEFSLMEEDEIFVLIVDTDYFYISNYGRCAMKIDQSIELISKVPTSEYQIMIEVFDYNIPQMVLKTMPTDKLVVETFIINYDTKYSNSIFHLGDDQEDFYYKNLFPVTKAQYRELQKRCSCGIKVDEQMVMELVNNPEWREPWFEDRYYLPSVSGVGYWGCPRIDSQSPAYRCWVNMLGRCFNQSAWKKQPGYKTTNICEEWLNFSTFNHWYYRHRYADGKRVLDLDHNIAFQDADLYSPYTAAFVPHYINMIVCYEKKNHIDGMPIGVYKDGEGMYMVKLSFFGEIWTSSKRFKYLKSAANAYKRYREKIIRDIAESKKGIIPRKIYDGLMKWVVDPKLVTLHDGR